MPPSLPIGIRLHDTAPGALPERLLSARRQGFCCAHLALSKAVEGFKMSEAPEKLTEEFAQAVKGDFAAAKMDCVLLGCYQQLTWRDEETLEKTREVYRAHLRFAKWMGAWAVGTETPAKGLTFSDGLPEESEEAYQLFLRGLRPLLRCAEEEGVPLAVEPVFCDVISTPKRAERLLEDAGSDYLRIILDGVNLLSGETAEDQDRIIEKAIRLLGDRVCLVHLKDYRLIPGDRRLESIACGRGSMRYERLLAFAKEKGLPMTLENTAPDNAEDTRLYLERLARNL